MYYFPRAAVTKYHKLGDLKQQKLFWEIKNKWTLNTKKRNKTKQNKKTTENDFPTILEAGSPKSRCWQSMIPPKAPRENPFCPFCFLGVLTFPWLVAASLQSLLHLYMPFLPGCLSVSLPLLIRTEVIGFRLTLNPGWFHPGILNSLLLQKLFSSEVTFEVTMDMNLGEHCLTYYIT